MIGYTMRTLKLRHLTLWSGLSAWELCENKPIARLTRGFGLP